MMMFDFDKARTTCEDEYRLARKRRPKSMDTASPVGFDNVSQHPLCNVAL